MKTCYKCKKELSFESFSKNKSKADGLNTACKQCMKLYYDNYYRTVPKEKNRIYLRNKDRKRSIRNFLSDTKNVPCMDCGVSYPPYVMDFDHRDRSKKSFTIARAVNGQKSRDALIEEIAKCDIVCSNCHRIRTHSGKALK